MIEDGDGHDNNALVPGSSINNTVKSETGISAITNIIDIPSKNITVNTQGDTHLKPQQIKVYYWIQVFSSYISQNIQGKLQIIQNILGENGSTLDNYLSLQNGRNS